MTEVVCTVLRPESERAVALAGALAERLSALLVLVDVRPLRPDPLPASAAFPAHAPPSATTGDPPAAPPPAPPPADLEGLARRAGVRPARCEHVEEPAPHALVRLSQREEVELLVAADQGHGPLMAALTGEAPRSAVRDLHAPLALVPDTGGPVALPSRPRIACAVDDDDVAATVAAYADALAARLGADLLFVHAGDDRERAEHLRRRCGSVVREGDAVALEILPGDAAAEVDAWAARRDADLLVLGRPARGALGSALRGSTAHSAARHGRLPVIVVPDAVHARREPRG